MPHSTTPGTETYGPGTFIDTHPLPVPDDARRVFEYLATTTPGFTTDKSKWDTVTFKGGSIPMIPGPIKAPVVAAALHAMCGVVANELVEIRDNTPATKGSVTIDTDHAGIWLGSTFTTHIDGTDVSTLARTGKLSGIFDRDFDQGFGKGISGRTTALYRTKDPKVWYQLHGSLNAPQVLESMGIDASVTFDSPAKYYEYIQSHVEKWSPDELEMHNVRHGLCGSICYTPAAWRETEMGRQLRKYPLVNYSREGYAAPTPGICLPKVEGDRRPLAGVKVLEMVRIIAGPTIGATLAAFGADVIRVNCSRLADLNVLQLTLNAGKRTIDLDIKNPTDRARLDALLADTDIFVQGFRYGALDRQGLGLRDLLSLASSRNKGIIYVDENCYGPDGPFAERPGWQQIGDAASGSSYIMGKSLGHEEGVSVLPPLPISDMTTGLVGALGALMAVRDRAVKGGSYHVVSSLVAADAVALEAEVGLYSPEVVEKTKEVFGFVPSSSDQFVTEIMMQVVDGWKRGLPGKLDEGSEFMTTFEKGPWGKQSLLRPVVRLGDEEVTPEWRSAPVPNCYHESGIEWL